MCLRLMHRARLCAVEVEVSTEQSLARKREYMRGWHARNPNYAKQWRADHTGYVTPPGDWFRQTKYGLDKRCRLCREWLPAEECFTTCATGAGGFANQCNACRNERRKRGGS